MKRIEKRVREARHELGMSQLDLSHEARVSLATVQNIEAGRANPSLATLGRILEALGLDIELVEKAADWDLLGDHGLPITRIGRARHQPGAATLLKHLRLAAREIDRAGAPDGRLRESLEALLLALRTSFPTRYRRWVRRAPLLERLTPEAPTGRVIKLRRIAASRLGEYL